MWQGCYIPWKLLGGPPASQLCNYKCWRLKSINYREVEQEGLFSFCQQKKAFSCSQNENNSFSRLICRKCTENVDAWGSMYSAKYGNLVLNQSGNYGGIHEEAQMRMILFKTCWGSEFTENETQERGLWTHLCQIKRQESWHSLSTTNLKPQCRITSILSVLDFIILLTSRKFCIWPCLAIAEIQAYYKYCITLPLHSVWNTNEFQV